MSEEVKVILQLTGAFLVITSIGVGFIFILEALVRRATKGDDKDEE